MSGTTQFTIPDGYYPPFAIVSDHDHGGWIIIATSLGLAMAILSTIIRIYVKVMSRQQLSLDDLLLAGGTLSAWLMESVLLAACARGLGRQVSLLSASSLEYVEKSFYSSQILTILALGFCKCSVASFIMRLTPKTSMKRIMQGILICSIAWTIASIIALALQCNLSSPWSYMNPGSCKGVWRRILLIGVFDIVLEVALFLAAILLIFKLQTAFYKKAVVILAFGTRLPLVGFISARLATFNRTDLSDFALSESLYIVWTVTQVNYSLISTTLPILRPFIKDLATFYGAMRPSEYSSARSNSYPLSSLKSKQSHPRNGSIPAPRQQSIPQDRLDTFDFAVPHNPAFATSTHCEADVQGGPSRTSEEPEMSTHSLGSNESQRMMIRVENQVTVETRDIRS